MPSRQRLQRPHPAWTSTAMRSPTANASIRTSTSAGPGSGTGFSARESSSGLPRTQAFIVGGMGYWLVPAVIAMLHKSSIEPDIGQVLANKMARGNIPALQLRRVDDDTVPP